MAQVKVLLAIIDEDIPVNLKRNKLFEIGKACGIGGIPN
jgi:hypothetical protein